MTRPSSRPDHDHRCGPDSLGHELTGSWTRPLDLGEKTGDGPGDFAAAGFSPRRSTSTTGCISAPRTAEAPRVCLACPPRLPGRAFGGQRRPRDMGSGLDGPPGRQRRPGRRGTARTRRLGLLGGRAHRERTNCHGTAVPPSRPQGVALRDERLFLRLRRRRGRRFRFRIAAPPSNRNGAITGTSQVSTAAPFIAAATSILNASSVPFRLKVLRNPGEYNRADAGVLLRRPPACAGARRRLPPDS